MASEAESLGATETAPRRESLASNNWGWFALRGVLAIIFGVLAVLSPFSALFAFTFLFAAFALADGVVSIISGVKGARAGVSLWWALILRGLIGVLVGIVFIAMPVLATLSYALIALVLISVWSIMVGAFEISAAIRLRKEIEGEWLLGLSGALSILLGIVIPIVLVTHPGPTLLSVGWVIGLYSLAAGIVLLVQAFRLRSVLRT